MAGKVALQVSEFTLSGVDTTTRKTIVEGQALVFAGSVASIAVVAGGAAWVVGDFFKLPGVTGGVGKVTAVTTGAVTAAVIVDSGLNGTATTAGAAAAILPSVGTGLTITTTITTNGGQIISLTSWAIVSNVLTFQAKNSLTAGGGQAITVQGFTGNFAFLNGTYTTSSATASAIVVPLTHANGSGSQQGVAVVQGSYLTGGIPISYGFIDLMGLPNPIGTIGPLAVPDWIELQTVSGSAFNYKVNTAVTPNLLVILSGVTEVSNAAAITADTIKFRAEFTKSAF